MFNLKLPAYEIKTNKQTEKYFTNVKYLTALKKHFRANLCSLTFKL